MPIPVFCAKLATKQGQKVFVNYCEHEAVEEGEWEEKEEEKKKRKWRIPYLMQPNPRYDVDAKGETCVIVDICFGKKTMKFRFVIVLLLLACSQSNKQALQMVIDIGFDGPKENFSMDMNRNVFKLMKNIKAKAEPIPAFSIKNENENSSELPEKSENLSQLMKALSEKVDPTNVAKVATVDSVSIPSKKFKTSSKQSDIKIGDAAEIKKANPEPVKLDAKVLAQKPLIEALDSLPKLSFQIVHRGELTVQDCLTRVERNPSLNLLLNNSRPRELVVIVSGLQSLHGVNLIVAEKEIDLSSDNNAFCSLHIDLPYHVNDGLSKAKFEKSTNKLNITLPVLPFSQEEIQKLQALLPPTIPITPDEAEPEIAAVVSNDASLEVKAESEITFAVNQASELDTKNDASLNFQVSLAPAKQAEEPAVVPQRVSNVDLLKSTATNEQKVELNNTTTLPTASDIDDHIGNDYTPVVNSSIKTSASSFVASEIASKSKTCYPIADASLQIELFELD